MINREKNYNVDKEIRIKTPMLRSDLCNFSDAYINRKRTITVADPDNAKRIRSVAFKKQFTIYQLHLKFNGVQIENA